MRNKSRKSLEHTGTFTAYSEDGEEFIIFEYTEGRTSSGPYRIEGLKELRLDDGRPVNRKEKGRYVIVGRRNFPDVKKGLHASNHCRHWQKQSANTSDTAVSDGKFSTATSHAESNCASCSTHPDSYAGASIQFEPQ